MDNTITRDLLTLSHEIGREDRGLALLGEGNTSARLSADAFLVKASGTSLGTLEEDDIVECRFPPLFTLMDKDGLSDEAIDDGLLAARADRKAKKPSVEAMFHAWLLSQPGVHFVGHCHPSAINQILCSPRAREFAEHRMFADEIVCCGMESAFVPLTDPGLLLARAVRREVTAFIARNGMMPRVVLMQNHGLIALGATWQAVLATTLMAEKAARVFVGAAQLGGPVFLPGETVRRIAGRPDELYRQKILKV